MPATASKASAAPGTGATLPIAGMVGVCVSSLLAATGAHADAQASQAPAAGATTASNATTASDVTANAGNAGDDLEQVTVTGVRSLLHDKLAEDQLDAPQSITLVSQALMVDQGDNRLEDALKNVPGITLNAGEGAARGDTVNLRGFSAFNDFFLDGIRDAAVYDRDSFDLQSVEVLKGPSAVLFGRGSTGGAINQVSKAPLLVPQDTVTTQFGTNDLYRATADLDTPIGAASAARLNLMGESSAVADREDVRNRRWGVAPAVSFGIGGPDTLTVTYLHQQEDNIPDVGIPFVDGRPASIPPVPRDAFFGLAQDRATADDDIATALYKHDFNTAVSLAETLRYGHYDFDYLFDAPNFGGTAPVPGEPLSSILVGRDAPSSSGIQTNLTEQFDLTARFDTGFVSHTLVTGIEIARQTNDLQRYVNPFNSNNGWVAQTPLLDPNPYETHPVEPLSSIQDTSAPSGGAYVVDTLGFGPYVDLTGGFRYDYFSADYDQLSLSSGARLHLQELNRLGSPRAALIIKPTPTQSYYLSYGTSFDPSAEALTLTTKTAGLGPVKAKTYEAGAKSELLGGGLLLTGALFHTEVDNAQTNDPDNPSITVLNGNERVNGLEVGATGHLTRQWEVYSGYTYLDGRTLASGTAADVGKVMPNVAHNSLNLWTEYELSAQWEVGAGGNWLGHRYADSAEMANVPGYVVWNAMASYVVSRNLTLQLNGLNLFNKLYYDALYYTSASENHAIPGPGRSVLLTARMSF
ncbi:MAG TPA: TonB-dependent siderophore receptor [Steroidobacteraceae bacterium]|jgi:catecholate siderophore receptor|nr:TonB-dependent siderophore receptor [Steroidobacteraceae bacterium]